MVIWTKRLPEHGVTVAIASGAVTSHDVTLDIQGLQATDASPRWLSYLDPTLDLSSIDVAFLPSLRRLMAAKLRELHGGQKVVTAMVSPSGVEDVFRRFWPNYAGRDRTYPALPAAFTSVEKACSWLGLSDAGCRAVAETIERETGSLHIAKLAVHAAAISPAAYGC
jgi:hypothetical protein